MSEPGLRPFSLDHPPLDGLRRNDARRRAETRQRTRRAGSAPGAWIHLCVIGIAGVTAIGAFFGIGFTLLTQTAAPLDTGRPEPAPRPVAALESAPAPIPAPTPAAAPTPAPAPAAQPAQPPAESHWSADDNSAPTAAPPSDAKPTPDKTEAAPLPPKPAAPPADPAPPTAKAASAPSPTATASPAPPPLPPISTAEAARFVHYGEGFLRHAELPAARLFFVAAAAAGDAKGALHMGETFDPATRSRAVRGQADPELARYWYRRAADLGSIEAELRLERLDHQPAR